MRSVALRSASSRVQVLRALFLLLTFGLAARAAHLTVWDTRGGERGDKQGHSTLTLPPERGLILDRNGVELTITLRAPSVYVIPSELEKIEPTASTLARILGLDGRRLAARLRDRDRFTFIKRWVSPEQAEQIRSRALPGAGIVDEPRRAYPAGPLAANLLGFVNIDGEGVRAIERQENETLRGRTRTVPVERDAKGRLFVVERTNPQDAAGGDIRLTIDSALQAEVEDALQSSVEKTGARGGVVVMLDPRTGDILSLAEAPSFDPNFFRQLDYTETRSRAFHDAVEPGSTLKVFLVAGALEAGVIRADEQIDTGLGRLAVPGKVIRDHHPYGRIAISDVIAVSSNVGAVLIGERLGPQRHYETLQSFGFGSRTGSGFPSESAGLLRHWQKWKTVDHATISFGQGVSATPIQLAAATAALASGGLWRTPRLVAARREHRGEWRDSPTETGRRVVSAETAATVLRMMEGVVSAEGTGRQAGLRHLRVAGKTGTAQKFDATTVSYSKQKWTAWFIGVVPADNPRLVIVVALDEPAGPTHGGGDVAAPLFAQVAAAGLGRLGIVTAPEPIPARPFPTAVALAKPDARAGAKIETAGASRATAASTPSEIEPKASATAASDTANTGGTTAIPRTHNTGSKQPAPESHRILMPDFRGETVASALRMAAREALTLELIGNERGLAVAQDPSPGTIVMGSQSRVWVRFTLESEEG
jgi:cell division protein FtsI (penicillin-binding protein 3)